MNEADRFDPAWDATTETEVAAWLREAGPRPEVPPGDMARLKGVARQAWQESYAAGSVPRAAAPRGRFPWALAAGLLLASGLAFFWWAQSSPTRLEQIAAIEVAGGDFDWSRQGRAVAPGTRSLAVGDWLETPAAAAGGPDEQAVRLAFRLAGGQSIRLDADSQVQLVAADRLELVRGAIYMDSDRASASEHVTIETPFGSVSDIGTQFEVRAGDAATGLTVRVREGAISLETATELLTAEAGEQLRLAPDGAVSRSSLAATDGAWSWVELAAPGFTGDTLQGFLSWIERETGLEVEFGDAQLERDAQTVVLSASIERLAPREAIDVVVLASGLVYTVSDGVLRLERPEAVLVPTAS